MSCVSALQIPAGWLADRYGGKRFFGSCILFSSVMSLLTPTAARLHFGVLVLLRVLSGLADSVLIPAMHALAPSEEIIRQINAKNIMLKSTFSGLINYNICDLI